MKFKNGPFSPTNLIIILIFVLNVGLLIHFRDKLGNFDDITLAIILSGIALVEAVISIFIVNKFLAEPINDLEFKVKSLLGGKFKGQNINFGKSSNESIDFILGGMDIISRSLRGVKGELWTGREIKTEVDLTKEIQGKILNKKIKNPPSLDIIAKSKPAGEIGGDSFDVIKQKDNYYIYVGDVTGHGVASGFIMVMVNALISGFSKIFVKGSQILAYTNEILKPRIKGTMIMSLLMVRWDEENKKLFMTGSGHEYLILYKADQKKCYKIKSGGLALGLTKNIHDKLKELQIKFEKDDILIMYTDGITEAKRKVDEEDSEMFGEDGLVYSIENAPNVNINGRQIKTAKSIFNNITIELSKFMGYNCKQGDDITLTVVHYKGDEKIEDNLPKAEEIDEAFITEWKW